MRHIFHSCLLTDVRTNKIAITSEGRKTLKTISDNVKLVNYQQMGTNYNNESNRSTKDWSDDRKFTDNNEQRLKCLQIRQI